MIPIRPTLAKRAPRGMEMARLGSREMREFIEAEAIDIFTTMTNGGCTFQQSLAAIFLSGMNAAEALRARLAQPDLAKVGEVGVWGKQDKENNDD